LDELVVTFDFFLKGMFRSIKTLFACQKYILQHIDFAKIMQNLGGL